MKEIQLTQGQVAKVDDWRFEELNQYKWYATWAEATQSYYAQRTERIFLKNHTIRMHRVVAGTPDGMVCDHINHDTLDNQEANLRNCTHSQNSMNQRGPRSDNSHGHLGIRQDKRHGTWQATIYIDGKQKCFPVRRNIEDAIEDRRQAEVQYYGEYRGDS